jgi:hypothetical protein
MPHLVEKSHYWVLPGTRRKQKFHEAVHGKSMDGDGVEKLLVDSLSALAIENRGIVEYLGYALENCRTTDS